MLRPLACLALATTLLLLACSEDESAPSTGGRGGSGGASTGSDGAATTSDTAGTADSGGKGGTGTGGTGAGGSGGTAGTADAGPKGGGGGSPGRDAAGDGGAAGDSAVDAAPQGGGGGVKFSFFVTSLGAMRRLSRSQDGFGGDLRYGEPTGLAGADKICAEVAEMALAGAGAKPWRAFLSTTGGGPNGGPVHAIDRVGDGPWYDRLGRLVAANKADLLHPRPRDADPAIVNDLPNEHGIPNHKDGAPGCIDFWCPNNHDVLTGTNELGRLYSTNPDSTCNDWTSAEPRGRPWCGHSWPREVSGVNWMSSLAEGGCAPGVNLIERGGARMPTVGSGGGYGGIYCFALVP
jgi:hypothetical protein